MTRTISTNDNAMMMNFRDVMISNDMRWNFADEMTAILDKMNSKDGAALANYTIHAKAGKVTKISDSMVKQSVTVKMLMPYAMEEGKRRFEVIIENGEVSPSSAGNILDYVLDKMFHVQSLFDRIKKWGVDSGFMSMYFEEYPLLKSTYENYGVAEMDRRFAEFSDYLISLGAVDPILEEIVDEAVNEQMKDFDKWVAGEDVDSGFGDDYMVKNDTPKLDNEDADVVKNDTPKLETEDTLTYENVKFFAEQYDIHMGCDGKYVLPRGIAQNNWDEYLTFVENIDLECTKEYWDKFWKTYCNVMRDLWKEEYEVVVDNCHDRLIFTPMIDENDAPKLDGWVDGEWAWEDDGTKPEAPADPEMKEWLESMGCKFEVDEDETETKEQTETNVCCICGKTYEGYGNNADPLANGRCCDECNADVIKRRAEYLYAYNILNPMVEKLGDSRTEMFVSECEVDGVPVTLELMRPGDRYMVFVKTHHEKGYEWFRLFNDYLDYAYNN